MMMKVMADPLGLRRVDRTPAAALIAAEIGERGPIPFERFMDLALYHPSVGYYNQGRPALGPEGDYVTSPELHGAFGALVCAQFEEMWRLLGRPDPFWLVEAGAGSGSLARDVLATAEHVSPPFSAAVRLVLVERADAQRERQQAGLVRWRDKVRWLSPDSADWVPLGEGCVFANELLDAFAVHWVVMRQAGLSEVWIDAQDHRFVESERPAAEGLEQQIIGGGARLPLGCFGEVNQQAPAWVLAAAQLITRGYLLLVDYGDDAQLLYSMTHPRGTLRCYQGQVLMQDPLELPGWRDITAHVDFSAVTRAATEAGLDLLSRTYQRSFLERLGLDALRGRIVERVPDRAGQRGHGAALDLLVEPSGLGGLTVLAFGKHAPAEHLAGFRPDSSGRDGTAVNPPETHAIWRLRGHRARLVASRQI